MSHYPCSGGCGQLADECACRVRRPLGSMVMSEPMSAWRVVPGREHRVIHYYVETVLRGFISDHGATWLATVYYRDSTVDLGRWDSQAAARRAVERETVRLAAGLGGRR